MHSIVVERSPAGSLDVERRSNMHIALRERQRMTSDLWSLFSKHSWGKFERPLCKSTGACQDQINGVLPSKYFKMPFIVLLIVFRTQREEARQEHVGVAWRASMSEQSN